MASRQNYSSSSQMINSQTSTTGSSTANVKEKTSSHSSNKTESSKMKHGKVIHKFTSESYLRLICEKSSSSNNISSSKNDEKKNFIDKNTASSSSSTSSSSSSTTGHIGTVINNISNSNKEGSKKERKGTSFQITSVSVSRNQHRIHGEQADHRNNGDHGEHDSADDLDDSHTDDNISRITDYETPSISETFSGEDVFFAQQNAFGTAPVIPTSSQYGLAIVGPDLSCGNGTNDVHVSVTDVGINIMGPLSSKQDPDHKNERFKVVKIESTEPFKRGRWMCMDYLDHTTLQDDGIDGKDGDSKELNEHVSGPKVLIVNNGEINHHPHIHYSQHPHQQQQNTVISDNEELDHEVNRINSLKQQEQLQASSNHQVTTTASHPQTMTSIPTNFMDHSSAAVAAANNTSHATMVAQSMPTGQIERILIQEKQQLTLNIQENILGAASNLPAPTESMLPETNGSHVSNTSQQLSHQHAQTMTQEMIQQQLNHHNINANTNNFHQGSTLPANILMQNISHDHQQQTTTQQQSQLSSPNSSNALPSTLIQTQQQLPIPATQSINISVTESGATAATATSLSAENEFSNSNNNTSNININSNNNNNNININNNNQDSMTSQFQTTQVVTGDRIQNESSDNQQQQTGSLVTNENINASSSSSTNNNNNNSDNNSNATVSNDGTPQNNASSPSSSAGGTTVVEGGSASNSVNDESASSNVNSSGNNNSATVGGADDGQAMSEDNER